LLFLNEKIKKKKKKQKTLQFRSQRISFLNIQRAPTKKKINITIRVKEYEFLVHGKENTVLEKYLEM
jgi:hypothetical protein